MREHRHASKTNEHPSPPDVVEASRRVLGRIDLDPASSERWNRRVRAAHYYAQPSEGNLRSGVLGGIGERWGTRDEPSRVFLNPPGGALRCERDTPPGERYYRRQVRQLWGTQSHAVAWWRKLVHECVQGRVHSAIFLGFSVEILQTAQAPDWLGPLSFPFCIPAQRQRFKGNAPTHANVVIYIGPHASRFRREFEALGTVRDEHFRSR